MWFITVLWVAVSDWGMSLSRLSHVSNTKSGPIRIVVNSKCAPSNRLIISSVSKFGLESKAVNDSAICFASSTKNFKEYSKYFSEFAVAGGSNSL